MTGGPEITQKAPGKSPPRVTASGQAGNTAERMSRVRQRRREGVRWVLSVGITQDRIDEWVSRGDLSEEDGENKQAVGEFVEWLINNGEAEGRASAPFDPVAADAAFASLLGDRSFGGRPIKPSVALPVVFGPGDEHNLSPRQRAVFVADERPGNRTLAANDTSRNWWPLRVTERRNDYEIVALLQSVFSAGSAVPNTNFDHVTHDADLLVEPRKPSAQRRYWRTRR